MKQNIKQVTQERQQRQADMAKLQQLKNQVGTWMFGVLSRFTRDQFVYTVKNARTNPDLKEFQSRLKSARTAYNEMLKLCTPKQQMFASKPFFCGVTFDKGYIWAGDGELQDSEGQVAEVGQPRNIIKFALSPLTEHSRDVTDTIPTVPAYNSFVEVISITLEQSTADTSKVMKLIDDNDAMLQKVIASQKTAFDELAKQKVQQVAPVDDKASEETTKGKFVNEDDAADLLDLNSSEVDEEDGDTQKLGKRAAKADTAKEEEDNNGQAATKRAKTSK